MSVSATDRATFRRRIGDLVKAEQDIMTSNGQDKSYLLRYDNVFDYEVYVDGVLQNDDGTVFSISASEGRLTFNTVVDADKAIKVIYSFAAYTDAEADELIEQYGVDKAVIEAIRGLLADSARLYSYQQGPTRAEQQQIFEHLSKLLESYQKDLASFPPDNSGGGGAKVGKRIHEIYRKSPRVSRDLSRDDI